MASRGLQGHVLQPGHAPEPQGRGRESFLVPRAPRGSRVREGSLQPAWVLCPRPFSQQRDRALAAGTSRGGDPGRLNPDPSSEADAGGDALVAPDTEVGFSLFLLEKGAPCCPLPPPGTRLGGCSDRLGTVLGQTGDSRPQGHVGRCQGPASRTHPGPRLSLCCPPTNNTLSFLNTAERNLRRTFRDI